MSRSQWKNILSCPGDLPVYLVDHKTDNKPYIGYGSAGIFFLRKGSNWSSSLRTPTHWAPIPMVKPPLVMEVRDYRISDTKDGHKLHLHGAGDQDALLLTVYSTDRDYLTAIGSWAMAGALPWTKVAEAVRKSRVASE